MAGSTIETTLRMGYLLFAFANCVRSCNITNLLEYTSAKRERDVAFFAIKAMHDAGCNPGLRKPPGIASLRTTIKPKWRGS